MLVCKIMSKHRTSQRPLQVRILSEPKIAPGPGELHHRKHLQIFEPTDDHDSQYSLQMERDMIPGVYVSIIKVNGGSKEDNQRISSQAGSLMQYAYAAGPRGLRFIAYNADIMHCGWNGP